jgi:hypothetical protein
MTGSQLIEKDQAERNARWIIFSRIAVVSYFLGVTIFIQFRALSQLPEEYLWTSYFLDRGPEQPVLRGAHQLRDLHHLRVSL